MATQEQESKINKQQLSAKAKSNLSQLDLELATSSHFFKPEPQKTYVIRINPEDKVEKVENTRFAYQDPNTGQTKVPVRYEFKIMHVDNGAEQLWTVSKTVCMQIAAALGKGFTVLEVTRNGTGKSTTYTIEGVQ
jgi:hypothetical protein